jgi:hypothetical protein
VGLSEQSSELGAMDRQLIDSKRLGERFKAQAAA